MPFAEVAEVAMKAIIETAKEVGEKVAETVKEISDKAESVFPDFFKDLSNEKLSDPKAALERNGFLPCSHGEWSGEPGNSTWIPDPEYTPPEKSRNPEKPYSNPDNLPWAELLDKYGIDGIEFKDGYPVFDDIARGTVEIEDFTDDRDSNFSQANEAMAELKGCTPEEVEQWMKDNNYTWHECQDCKTMQKVPNEIHANIPHEGGVSVYKALLNATI